jgi:hypothetical protein
MVSLPTLSLTQRERRACRYLGMIGMMFLAISPAIWRSFSVGIIIPIITIIPNALDFIAAGLRLALNQEAKTEH